MLSSMPQKRSPEGNVLHVRCVLFDLDGTLYESPEYSDRLETEIVSFVSERLALDESETKELLNQRRKQLGTLTRTIQSLGIDRNVFLMRWRRGLSRAFTFTGIRWFAAS